MVSYEEREVEIESVESMLLIDFIAVNLGALSETQILSLENLQAGDDIQIGKMRVLRTR